MQKKRTALRTELTQMKWVRSEIPLGTVCQLVYCLGASFQMKPQLCRPQCRNELWIYFPQASLQCDDFFEAYGACLASLSQDCPVSICGFSDFLEEGELSVSLMEDADGQESGLEAEWRARQEAGYKARHESGLNGSEGRGVICTKKNVSGRNFDILSAVWLKIRFPRRMEADFVSQVIEGIDFEWKASAVCGRWEDVFPEKELFERTGMSRFRYVFFGEPGDPALSMISCLSVLQMKELWLDYLTDRKEALELGLFYERLDETPEYQRLGLMTALRLALSERRIRIEHSGGEFRVLDEEGGRLWFDFASRSPSEKLFLKLIFPLH